MRAGRAGCFAISLPPTSNDPAWVAFRAAVRPRASDAARHAETNTTALMRAIRSLTKRANVVFQRLNRLSQHSAMGPMRGGRVFGAGFGQRQLEGETLLV